MSTGEKVPMSESELPGAPTLSLTVAGMAIAKEGLVAAAGCDIKAGTITAIRGVNQ